MKKKKVWWAYQSICKPCSGRGSHGTATFSAKIISAARALAVYVRGLRWDSPLQELQLLTRPLPSPWIRGFLKAFAQLSNTINVCTSLRWPRNLEETQLDLVSSATKGIQKHLFFLNMPVSDHERFVEVLLPAKKKKNPIKRPAEWYWQANKKWKKVDEAEWSYVFGSWTPELRVSGSHQMVQQATPQSLDALEIAWCTVLSSDFLSRNVAWGAKKW